MNAYISLIVLLLLSFRLEAQGLDNPLNSGGELPTPESKLKKPDIFGTKKTTTFFQDPFKKTNDTHFYQEDENLKSVSKEAKEKVEQANKNLDADIEKKSAGLTHSEEQYLGEIRVKGGYVSIECRDYGIVDGDRVRVIVNGFVVANNIYITGSFKGIPVDLERGRNEINFIALNEGDYSPNTAQFKVYNNADQLVTLKEWALYEGAKATIIVVND